MLKRILVHFISVKVNRCDQSGQCSAKNNGTVSSYRVLLVYKSIYSDCSEKLFDTCCWILLGFKVIRDIMFHFKLYPACNGIFRANIVLNQSTVLFTWHSLPWYLSDDMKKKTFPPSDCRPHNAIPSRHDVPTSLSRYELQKQLGIVVKRHDNFSIKSSHNTLGDPMRQK